MRTFFGKIRFYHLQNFFLDLIIIFAGIYLIFRTGFDFKNITFLISVFGIIFALTMFIIEIKMLKKRHQIGEKIIKNLAEEYVTDLDRPDDTVIFH